MNLAVRTVANAAPKQLMGLDIDGRADQYALAATAYHLLTGSQLYPSCNPAVVISRHLNAEPPRAHFYLHVRGWRAGWGHDEIAGQCRGQCSPKTSRWRHALRKFCR